MISERLARLSAELATQRQPFVTATVVRVQHPTSVTVGATAVVRRDGTIEGFVGGVCAENNVRLYALRAIQAGEPVLLRIVHDPQQADDASLPDDAGEEIEREEGAVTVRNPCLSGGAIEVFLEPSLPAPRVLVAGDSPIAGALARIGPELGLEVLTAGEGRDPLVPTPSDLALVVAAHGRGELEILRAGLEAGLPYVGLVASPKRGAAVLDELNADGVDRELLERVDTPAGIELGARTAGEIALAILAQVVRVRRSSPTDRAAVEAGSFPTPAAVGATAATTAVDPICGMTVLVGPETLSAQRGGESHYFCCEGCRRAFLAAQQGAETA